MKNQPELTTRQNKFAILCQEILVIFLPSVWTLRYCQNTLIQSRWNLQKVVVEIAGGIGQMRKLVIVDTIVGIMLERTLTMFKKHVEIALF